MQYYRTFLAIPLHSGINKRLSGWLHPHAVRLGLRTVPPENRHLTLAFLGETPVEQIGPIADALCERLDGFAAGQLSVEGLGVFPAQKVPRVFWVGCRGGEWLGALYTAVYEVLDRFGFPPERAGFSPHITLSRLKTGVGEAVRELVEGESEIRFGSWIPDALLYYASVPEKGGVSYSVLATIPF